MTASSLPGRMSPKRQPGPGCVLIPLIPAAPGSLGTRHEQFLWKFLQEWHPLLPLGLLAFEAPSRHASGLSAMIGEPLTWKQ